MNDNDDRDLKEKAQIRAIFRKIRHLRLLFWFFIMCGIAYGTCDAMECSQSCKPEDSEWGWISGCTCVPEGTATLWNL